MAQGGAAAVYILDDARRIELAAGLRDQLAALPGMAAVLTPDQFEQIGQPTRVLGDTGFEPVTSCVSCMRSNQLS